MPRQGRPFASAGDTAGQAARHARNRVRRQQCCGRRRTTAACAVSTTVRLPVAVRCHAGVPYRGPRHGGTALRTGNLGPSPLPAASHPMSVDEVCRARVEQTRLLAARERCPWIMATIRGTASLSHCGRALQVLYLLYCSERQLLAQRRTRGPRRAGTAWACDAAWMSGRCVPPGRHHPNRRATPATYCASPGMQYGAPRIPPVLRAARHHLTTGRRMVDPHG